ncbi:unnamed protein product [Owenia fusiformis]|uniref:Uncharacterized protein n=1 Tax=Owenia fusiformis TaxID=6347 RepID=A0A8J1TT72_OWEFU|nr:unnamed protein product [Owenia fusiformis]
MKLACWKSLKRGCGVMNTAERLLVVLLILIVICDAGFPCPSECQCTTFTRNVNCEFRKLTIIPLGLPGYTEFLYLPSNNISTLENPHAFHGLVAIRVLILRHNAMRTINKGIFRTLKTLVTLDLSSNMLTRVNKGMFYRLSNLTHLYLSNNRLGEGGVEASAFTDTPNLEYLSLRNNGISYLHDDVFKGLNKLLTLNLGENKLGTLDDYIFKFSPNLANLYIDSNRITVISREFRKLKHMKVLNLNNNNIQTLLHDTIPQTLGLNLHIKENPFHCSCEMKWIKRTIKETAMKVDGYCLTPEILNGKHFAQILEQDFACKQPQFVNHNPCRVTREGSKVTALCTAAGNPAPTISCTSPYGVNHVQKPSSDKSVNRTIASWKFDLSNPAMKKDFFTCNASNIAGHMSQPVQLIFVAQTRSGTSGVDSNTMNILTILILTICIFQIKVR